MSARFKLSILIPAYNESATIREVVRRALDVRVDVDRELIIVDDCSSDGTQTLIAELAHSQNGNGNGNGNGRIKVLFHDRNRGKGAAIRTALAHATGQIILVQDADLELDPADYPKLLEPILRGQAEVVYGNRYHNGQKNGNYQLCYWGNRSLTLLANRLARLNLGDMGVGYKVFRRELLEKMNLRSNGFGFDPEVTMKVARLGHPIYQVPISYKGRTYAEGKKIKWRDGIIHVYNLFRFRLFD